MHLKDARVDAKIRLAAAWTALIALYIYGDFLSLYRPGQLDEIRRGVLGPFDVSQWTLLVASLIVMIPAVMIVLSLLLPTGANRTVNLVLTILYTLVNFSNLVGEEWAYYFLFGIAEIAITVHVFFTAWRWPIRSRTSTPEGEVDPTRGPPECHHASSRFTPLRPITEW
jgi:hypothetical protein